MNVLNVCVNSRRYNQFLKLVNYLDSALQVSFLYLSPSLLFGGCLGRIDRGGADSSEMTTPRSLFLGGWFLPSTLDLTISMRQHKLNKYSCNGIFVPRSAISTYVIDPFGDPPMGTLPAKVTRTPTLWFVKKAIHIGLVDPLGDWSNGS
ncbi:hypothetical protein H5410_021729 [Solanum commersonii]|uniref:Uncharacterized protein n=1 Tax=Solanum commersonii TaxID=4109 RepID=A0A9J5ZF31_SOLCO|nr:hypothetical protein H5410_021729 [Solanum commersonii]